VKAELYYGALKSARPVENLRKQKEFLQKFRSLPFDDLAADEYGRIRSRLEKSGTPIGPNDLLIAAIAIANDVTVVTHNLDEFERVEGIKVEDWRV
jgi:tRNA(fMet)-specific endonuclease VapC